MSTTKPRTKKRDLAIEASIRKKADELRRRVKPTEKPSKSSGALLLEGAAQEINAISNEALSTEKRTKSRGREIFDNLENIF